jgi:hypothetical protein
MPDYKLDRTAFRMMSFKEVDAANIFAKNVPLAERLRQATYLISQVYGFAGGVLPKLDRRYFSSRKLND